jgi:hypothetical protein
MHLTRLLITAALALACAAAPAQAVTRYVTAAFGANSGECGSANACTIGWAFGKANAGDTVSLGQGTYTVNAGIVVAERLDITATAPQAVHPLVQSNDAVPIELGNGSDGSTISHVRFKQAGDNSDPHPALQVRESATLTDVEINTTTNCLFAMHASKTVTIEKLDATQTAPLPGPCVSSFGGPMNVSGSTITSANGTALGLARGLVADSKLSGTAALLLTGPSTGRRLTISASFAGVQMTGGALLADSLITVSDSGDGIQAYAGPATAENVTIIGNGAGTTGLHSQAIGSTNSAGDLTVRNGIIRAGTDLRNDGTPGNCMFPPCPPSVLHAASSNFVTRNGTVDDLGGNITGDPQFVGAPDYHLQRSSPSVDTGAASGTLGATDLGGLPRIVGPAVDMGAYEFQGSAPVVTTGVVTDVTTSTASLHGTVDAGDLPTTATFAFGESTDYGTTVPGSALAAQFGPQPVTAELTGLLPGRTYHVRLGASNAQGAANGEDVTFTTTGTVSETPVPVVTNFRATPRRFRVGAKSTAISAAKKRKPPRGTRLRFTLDEQSDVKITFAQRVKVNGKRRWVPIKASLSRAALAAGNRSIRFSGRLGTVRFKRGSWRATLGATAAGAPSPSKPQRARFTVVRG